MAEKPIIPSWVYNIGSDEKFFNIISVDLSGSSKIKNRLEFSDKKARKSQELVRDIVVFLSNNCEGWFFFWAGDGGAILFDDNKLQKDKALKFVFCLHKLCAKKLVQWGQLNAALNEEDNFNKYRAKIFTKLAEYLDKFDIKDYKNDNAEYDEVKNSISFRIVCHKAKISIDPHQPETVYGDDLSFLLKYEREMGLKNSISATTHFIDGDDSLPFSIKSESVLRKPRNRNPIDVQFYPQTTLNKYRIEKNFFPSAALIDCKKDKYINRITSLFTSGGSKSIAAVYNIGLGTLKNEFNALWKKLINDNVEVRLILPVKFQGISCPLDLKPVLQLVLSKHLNDQGKKEILERIKIKIVDLEELKGNYYEYMDPHFGFSLYYVNNIDDPIEGTNFYLLKTFCNWDPLKDEFGYWEYIYLFYLMDIYAASHLQKLHQAFNKIWYDDDIEESNLLKFVSE